MKETITFGGVRAGSGEKASGHRRQLYEDPRFPILLVNGVDDGRIILITAGVHGFEYPGILASLELFRDLDPGKMRGAVVILPIVNPSGFYGRIPYVCPEDEERKNLNRLAPGDPKGSFGDQLMAYLYREFVRRADFHIDLHSGDATEDLIPFAAVGNIPDSDVRDFLHEAVRHTSFSYRTQSGGETEFYNGSARQGIPSLLFEVGGAGSWSREEVAEEKENLRRILQVLEVLPGDAPVNPEQVLLTEQSWIRAGVSGIFCPFVTCGEEIRKGQRLYEIQDIFGEVRETHDARHGGKVMILNRTLAIAEGDDTVFYGK